MRYYCHHCHTQINAEELLPEFTCPSCHSGFVEEIPVQTARRVSSVDRASSDDGTGFISTRMSSDEYSDDNSDVEFLDAVNGPLAQVFSLFQPHQQQLNTANTAGQSSQQQQQQQGQQQQQSDSSTSNQPAPTARVITRSVNRTLGRNSGTGQILPAYIDPGANQSLADVLNEFITGVSFGTHYPDASSSTSQGGSGASGSGPMPANRGLINIDFPLPFFLHSNPGDYAWGNAGFDAVITQLLNNLDGSNSGPPPMPKDQVENLPNVKITDGQVKNSNLQCTVCMDDFQVGDSARQLPCEHFFHQDCILPWLNLHASCPICRKNFVTGTNATAQTLSSDTPNEATSAASNVNSTPNHSNSGSTVVGDLRATNRNAASSTTVTNQNVAPNYDYTEDDCD